MLIIVSAKPKLFTNVNAVPLFSASAFWATRVENIGESAITAIPQIVKNNKKIGVPNKKAIGEMKQQTPEINKNIAADFLAPIFSDKYPLKTQDKLPIPIICLLYTSPSPRD